MPVQWKAMWFCIPQLFKRTRQLSPFRRAISSKDAEKQSNAKEAKASLLEVYSTLEVVNPFKAQREG